MGKQGRQITPEERERMLRHYRSSRTWRMLSALFSPVWTGPNPFTKTPANPQHTLTLAYRLAKKLFRLVFTKGAQ